MNFWTCATFAVIGYAIYQIIALLVIKRCDHLWVPKGEPMLWKDNEIFAPLEMTQILVCGKCGIYNCYRTQVVTDGRKFQKTETQVDVQR